MPVRAPAASVLAVPRGLSHSGTVYGPLLPAAGQLELSWAWMAHILVMQKYPSAEQ